MRGISQIWNKILKLLAVLGFMVVCGRQYDSMASAGPAKSGLVNKRYGGVAGSSTLNHIFAFPGQDSAGSENFPAHTLTTSKAIKTPHPHDPGFLAEQKHCPVRKNTYYKGTQYDLLMYEVVSRLSSSLSSQVTWNFRAEFEFVVAVPKILGTPGLGSIYSGGRWKGHRS
jgi:hypothetical protein